MRFKPRTDLERVYDSLKEREVIDSKSLKRQMHKMGLVSQTFQNESLDSDDEDNYYNATNYNYAKQKMLEQNEEYKKKMNNKKIPGKVNIDLKKEGQKNERLLCFGPCARPAAWRGAGNGRRILPVPFAPPAQAHHPPPYPQRRKRFVRA